jgi:hypothetical protein
MKSGGSWSRIRHLVKIGRGHRGSGIRLMSTTSFIYKTRFELLYNCWGIKKLGRKGKEADGNST